MFRLVQIEQDISQALGIPVAITTRNALYPFDEEQYRAGRNVEGPDDRHSRLPRRGRNLARDRGTRMTLRQISVQASHGPDAPSGRQARLCKIESKRTRLGQPMLAHGA